MSSGVWDLGPAGGWFSFSRHRPLSQSWVGSNWKDQGQNGYWLLWFKQRAAWDPYHSPGKECNAGLFCVIWNLSSTVALFEMVTDTRWISIYSLHFICCTNKVVIDSLLLMHVFISYSTPIRGNANGFELRDRKCEFQGCHAVFLSPVDLRILSCKMRGAGRMVSRFHHSWALPPASVWVRALCRGRDEVTGERGPPRAV